MNFVEKWFGVTPDLGSGSLEVSLLLMVAAICAMVFAGQHLIAKFAAARARRAR